MREIKILHLTDLHLSDTSDKSDEHLSESYYQLYIEEMCKKIIEKHSSIDVLIISGDFVDRGKIENYNHAAKVIQQIYFKLNLNESKVGVCIGNHDIKCTFEGDKEDRLIKSEDRSAYSAFADKYANKTGHIFSNDRFTISKIDEDILFLSIDSTLNRKGKDIPGIIEDNEFSELILKIKEVKTTKTSLLIIATHYPCVHFYHYPFPTEAGWHDEHFWSTGEHLRHRINREIRDIKVLWLFGDAHQPAQMKMSNNVYIMSGRFGTSSKYSSPTPIPRHAQVIYYKHNKEAEISILNYQPKSHDKDSQDGIWKFSEGDTHQLPLYQPELIIHDSSDTSSLEETIIQNIISHDLYSFGRFVPNKNKDEVSLGWVSINQLLNQRDILAPIIKSSKEWILKKKLNSEKFLIIGIDFWGAIIASNVSIMLGCYNICFASRGDSQHHTSNILLSDEKCCKLIKEYNSILIITDVVSSGWTLHKIYSTFKKNCSKEETLPKFSSISVISDIRQEKKVNLNFLESFGTFCGNLRIPIFKNEDLPPIEIMPAKHYLQ